jgi:hypothetical protein
MPKKTYTREVETLFSKEEMTVLMREAHAHCKNAVKETLHRIGKTRRRTVKMRKREDYLNCIKEFIHRRIAERAGVPVEQVKTLIGS